MCVVLSNTLSFLFFQEVLGQVLVARLPDPLALCSQPSTPASLAEMDSMLTLLTAAAAQCPQREHFIASIKGMDVADQQHIAEKIKRVMNEPYHVWPAETLDEGEDEQHRRDRLYPVLVDHVKRVAEERDELASRLVQVRMNPIMSSPFSLQKIPLTIFYHLLLFVRCQFRRHLLRTLPRRMRSPTEDLLHLPRLCLLRRTTWLWRPPNSRPKSASSTNCCELILKRMEATVSFSHSIEPFPPSRMMAFARTAIPGLSLATALVRT